MTDCSASIRRKLLVGALILCGAGATTACGPGTQAPPSPNPMPVDPAQLAAPAAGKGLQLKTEAFVVDPGSEVQACYFFKVADLASAAGFDPTKPVDVHRVQIVQRAGSHHMNLFRVRTIKNLDPANGAVQTGVNGQGQCFVSSNWADWPLIANDQGPGAEDWSYPDGVVNELNPTDYPDETLMLQTHFVNASTQQTPSGLGQVAMNLWTLPADQVTAQMGTVFATNQSIRICQGISTPSYSATCHFNNSAPVTVVGANGHFHSRGTEFDIYAWDGTTTGVPDVSARFYQSTTWDEPPMLHSPALEANVPAGGGIVYSCQYQWQPPPNAIGCAGLDTIDLSKSPMATPDCCYRFGPQVDVNEHCNAFVYYYPKQDNVNCF
jgi:hypothetical protein